MGDCNVSDAGVASKRVCHGSEKELGKAVQLIREARNIMVLTGAGISVSCGIPDFRSADGIYATLKEKYPELPNPQAMFKMDYFRRNPRPFFKFAKEIYPGRYKPSLAHLFIRELEKRKKLLRNFTQNIDTLDAVANIKKTVYCHGTFATATCMRCGVQVSCDAIKEDIFAERVPYCTACSQNSPPTAQLASSDDGQQATSSLTNVEGTSSADVQQATSSLINVEGTNSDDVQQATSSLTNVEGTNSDDVQQATSSLPNIEGTNSDDVQQATSSLPNVEGTNCDNVQQATSSLTNVEDISSDQAGSDVTVVEVAAPPPQQQPIMKPDIVFFGEDLQRDYYTHVHHDLGTADLLIVMGSSLSVYPVRSIPFKAALLRIPCLLINKQPVTGSYQYELLGDCDSIVQVLADRLGYVLGDSSCSPPSLLPGTVTSSSSNDSLLTSSTSSPISVMSSKPHIDYDFLAEEVLCRSRSSAAAASANSDTSSLGTVCQSAGPAASAASSPFTAARQMSDGRSEKQDRDASTFPRSASSLLEDLLPSDESSPSSVSSPSSASSTSEGSSSGFADDEDEDDDEKGEGQRKDDDKDIQSFTFWHRHTPPEGMLYDFYPPNRLLFKDAEVQVTYDPSAFADFDFEYFGDAAPAYLDAELATRLASIDDTVVTE